MRHVADVKATQIRAAENVDRYLLRRAQDRIAPHSGRQHATWSVSKSLLARGAFMTYYPIADLHF